jgi:hypothetical protein
MQGGKASSIPVVEVSGQPQDLLYYHSSESMYKSGSEFGGLHFCYLLAQAFDLNSGDDGSNFARNTYYADRGCWPFIQSLPEYVGLVPENQPKTIPSHSLSNPLLISIHSSML